MIKFRNNNELSDVLNTLEFINAEKSFVLDLVKEDTHMKIYKVNSKDGCTYDAHVIFINKGVKTVMCWFHGEITELTDRIDRISDLEDDSIPKDILNTLDVLTYQGKLKCFESSYNTSFVFQLKEELDILNESGILNIDDNKKINLIANLTAIRVLSN
jgi:hypothetical protein